MFDLVIAFLFKSDTDLKTFQPLLDTKQGQAFLQAFRGDFAQR